MPVKATECRGHHTGRYLTSKSPNHSAGHWPLTEALSTIREADATVLYRPASRANMGIAYEKFLDLLEEVEIHVIDMLYPDSDKEKSERSEQGLAAS